MTLSREQERVPAPRTEVLFRKWSNLDPASRTKLRMSGNTNRCPRCANEHYVTKCIFIIDRCLRACVPACVRVWMSLSIILCSWLVLCQIKCRRNDSVSLRFHVRIAT